MLMGTYEREEVVETFGLKAVEDAEQWLLATLQRSSADYLVYEFYSREFPAEVKKVLGFNGGDEDWAVLTFRQDTYTPFWIERMDSCSEPDEYQFGDIKVYVGCHA
jgi:hypothetical protein